MTDAIAILEGGQVQRLHGLPHHVDYSVAKHSWGMAVLCYAIHPNPSKELIYACLLHDVAERWTGDIPAPAKWNSPELCKAAEDFEDKINKKLGIDIFLTDIEKAWLAALDNLELYQYCLMEEAVGNRAVTQILANCDQRLKDNYTPKEIRRWHQTHQEWMKASDIWAT